MFSSPRVYLFLFRFCGHGAHASRLSVFIIVLTSTQGDIRMVTCRLPGCTYPYPIRGASTDNAGLCNVIRGMDGNLWNFIPSRASGVCLLLRIRFLFVRVIHYLSASGDAFLSLFLSLSFTSLLRLFRLSYTLGRTRYCGYLLSLGFRGNSN